MPDETSHDPTVTAAEELPPEDRARAGGPDPGVALCLSGGGYRAMLFHLGSLWALNDHKYLQKLDRISSVSGGSIIAAHLGLSWSGLTFQNGGAVNFLELIVKPIRR